MKCPYCGSLNDKVAESRQNESGTAIRRRRECLDCNYRFTSYENVRENELSIIKRNGKREAFDLSKLERGLLRAMEKRPISRTEIDDVLHKIEDALQMKGRASREIKSEEIGEMVLEKLFNLDAVAYVRFASVYGDFNEVKEFIEVIEKIPEEKRHIKN